MPGAQGRKNSNVRIGPISVFTLIAALCIAVLSVLAISTANASLVITQRQANSTQELYRDEAAAQTFLAGVDAQLASGADAVKDALPQLCERAEAAADGKVKAEASMEGTLVTATFTCNDTRSMEVRIAVDGGECRIEHWKMKAVENEAQPDGELWTGM